jgi:hypothetical protein
MDDNVVTTRRPNVARVAQGNGLPPPPAIATAQKEVKENMGKRLQTHRGMKDVNNVNHRDQGDNRHVTMSHPFHLSRCRRCQH